MADEYARQMSHASNRKEDARRFLAEHPNRGLEFAWRDPDGNPAHVIVDHQFYQGIHSIVMTRVHDLGEAIYPFGPDDPNAPR